MRESETVCVFVCVIFIAHSPHAYALIKSGIQAIRIPFAKTKLKSTAFDCRVCVCVCVLKRLCDDHFFKSENIRFSPHVIKGLLRKLGKHFELKLDLHSHRGLISHLGTKIGLTISSRVKTSFYRVKGLEFRLRLEKRSSICDDHF